MARLWHNILSRDEDSVRCRGCGASKLPCPMCMTALSDECCVDADYVHRLDIMAHLELGLERAVSICTTAPAMLLPEMRRMELCSFCVCWFAERDSILRHG